MSDSTSLIDALATGQTNLPMRINETFDAQSPSALYGRRASTSANLVWGYYGGRFSSTAIANGTVTATASTTNYVVAARTTGAVSIATTITNWNDTSNYLRLYLLTAGASTITAYEDHRQAVGASGGGGGGGFANPMTTAGDLIAGGASGAAQRLGVGSAGMVLTVVSGVPTWQTPAGGGAVGLGNVNVYTKNQSVAPATLASGASIPVDAALSNNLKLVLGANATLANPSNLTDGMVLNFRIKQDATGGRTLAYGSFYKFSGGAAPVLSTAANAVDLMSCYYDATDGVLACNLNKGFA